MERFVAFLIVVLPQLEPAPVFLLLAQLSSWFVPVTVTSSRRSNYYFQLYSGNVLSSRVTQHWHSPKHTYPFFSNLCCPCFSVSHKCDPSHLRGKCRLHLLMCCVLWVLRCESYSIFTFVMRMRSWVAHWVPHFVVESADLEHASQCVILLQETVLEIRDRNLVHGKECTISPV